MSSETLIRLPPAEIGISGSPGVEAAVASALRQRTDGIVAADNSEGIAGPIDRSLIEQHLDKVTVGKGALEIGFRHAEDEMVAPLLVPWTPVPTSRRRDILVPADHESGTTLRPIRSEDRTRLLKGVAKARIWLDDLVSGRTCDTREIASQEGCSERSVRMTLNLDFLNPVIVKAAVEGTLPFGTGLSHLAGHPPDWQQQMEGLHH